MLITFKIIFKNFQNNCIIIASMEITIKHISVSTTRMYGLFEITGNVNGEWITTTTTDSFIFDNRNGYDCDSEEELLSHEQAMEFCKMRLLEKYNL